MIKRRLQSLKPEKQALLFSHSILPALLFFLTPLYSNAQTLKLNTRKTNAVGGIEFAKSIADTNLSLQKREQLIFKEIKRGNVPDFLRDLKQLKDSIKINKELIKITYFVTPDYFAIGSNEDFFYVPMTPILAQKVANLTKCSLPTRKMVDQIYQNATIQLPPQPIPPSKSMITVHVFLQHSKMINSQLKPYLNAHSNSKLTSGNKKDIIISNKIYGEKSSRVVIYGWHQLNGKAIQPLYNKHTNTWADYSHGVRLVQQKVLITKLDANGKVSSRRAKSSVKKIVKDLDLHPLLSDEGMIKKANYPPFKDKSYTQ